MENMAADERARPAEEEVAPATGSFGSANGEWMR